MLRAEVHVGLGWVAAISLVSDGGDLRIGDVARSPMLFGARPDAETVQKSPSIVTIPLIGALVGCGALGVLAWPLNKPPARRPRWWSCK